MPLPKALRKRLQRFHDRLQRLEGEASTKNVHEFRIACRELLTFSPMLKDLAPATRWKPIVKKALSSLGRLRDLQQMRQHLRKTRSLPPAQLRDTFERPLRKALARWQKFVPELQEPKFIIALAATDKALLSMSDNSAALQTEWEQQWQKSLRRVRKYMLAADSNNLDSLHHLRIRFKELRYLLELRLQAGASDTVQKEALKEWQEMLGDIGDLRVMAHYARKLELPASLHQQYLRQAAQHAERFMQNRAAFAAFLAQLDQQLEL